VPTTGDGADATLTCTRATWNDLLSGRSDLASALAGGSVTLDGDTDGAVLALAALDHPAFR